MSEEPALDKSKIMADNGWDKGFVYFGHPATETTVKVVTAVQFLTTQDNFPFKKEDGTLKHVILNFDDKPIAKDDEKNEVSLGIDSAEYKCVSGGRTFMPAVAIDGEMFFESGEIVKMLHEKYPDSTLTPEEKKQVDEWIQFNIDNTNRMLVALKHFGWCFMQGARPNYVAYGKGNKDDAWEKELVKDVHVFFEKMDKHFVDKKEPAFFVGDKLTMADCVMINWPWSFHLIVELKIEERYPNVWKHFNALKDKAIAGSDAHYNVFPYFANVVTDLAKEARAEGFHIENEKHW
ncbi:expressed unknown protein [Seminavis robusta]|uniref:GST C-terminal domain-containing protein n=1 Tax=Seminavis robusta TaxID=568900 RepID=A0A9N8DPG8_9STRA|nr:expressed unknown protein [Seminavis robusta]|eukprot:Sro194_g082750.1 n/a (292) ;mRNA; r:26764-27639